MNTFNRPFDQFRFHQSCSLPFNNLKQVCDCRSGVHSPRYFHTTHLVNNCLYLIHCLLQMLWPSVAHWYAEIIEDLSLLHWFPQEEYSSAQKLPCLGAPQLRLISEGFFTHITSPDRWGKTGVEFVTLTGPKESGKTTNTVIHITNRVEESDLSLVKVFCHPDQARMDACDTLSALCQCDSSELSIVVVRRYSNTAYIPRGMSCALYLDMDTFSRGVASTQFPLDRLHLSWLHPFSKSEVLLPSKVEEEGLKMYPHLWEFLWDRVEKEHCFSSLISLSIPLMAPALLLKVWIQTKEGLDSHSACIHTEGGLGCHPASTQTEGLGYHPSLKLLQEANQDRA